MTVLTDILVGNALAAAVLAVVVFAGTRVWRNPHVGHALWLIVLLKLIVPPAVEVPVFRGPIAESRPEALPVAPRSVRQASEDGMPARPIPREASGRQPSAQSAPEDSPQPVARDADLSELQALPSRREAHENAAAPRAALGWGDWARIAWLAGSVLVACIVALRAGQFGRAVREMLPAATHLQTRAIELANRLRLRRCPAVRLTTADLVPLVWCGPFRQTIVLPSRLVSELADGEIRTILAHELAHLARRDHWTRWLEVAVTIVFWWHPAPWIARRELRRSEDMCCDAYVLRMLPGHERTYAEAMLRTASFVSRGPRSVPMLCSSFGSALLMKRRIEMVLMPASQHQLTRMSRTVLLATAAVALAASAGVTQDDKRPGDEPQAEQNDAVDRQPAPVPQAFQGGFAEVAAREGKALSLDFSSDGTKLVGACNDHVVRVWDARLGYPIHLLTGHTSTPNAVVITPDDATVLSASYNGEIFAWDLESGLLKRRVQAEGARDKLLNPTFTKDAELLVTVGRDDETVYVWEVATGALRQSIPLAPFGKPRRIAVPHNTSVAVLSSVEQGDLAGLTVSVWDLATGELRFAHATGWGMAFSSAGDRLAAATAEGIQIVDMQSGDVVRTLPGRPRSVNAMSFSPDGSILAIGGSGTEVREYSSFRSRLRTVSEVQAWDVATGRRILLDGSVDGGFVWSLAFTDDSRYLARCDDEQIVVQDPRQGKHQTVIPVPPPTSHGGAGDDRAAELAHILHSEGAARHEQWLAVVWELREIGKPAVAPLVEELDRTDDRATMRILGFALRAVGQPEAVPGLIRAIPKTLQPSGSDLGLQVDDAELERFAQEHDLDAGDRDGFGLGRPVREILGALTHITGVSLGEEELYSISLGGGRRQQQLQREFYQRVADRWQAWWEENWHEYLDDPAVAEVDSGEVPRRETVFLTDLRMMLGVLHAGAVVESMNESATGVFIDFDTNRRPTWPVQIPRPDSRLSELPVAVDQWAADEGVDVVGVEYRPTGSDEWFYCPRGLDLEAWQIDNSRWETIREEIRGPEPLKLGRLVEDGYLMHFDETAGQYDPTIPATFLFITREGARGILQTMGQVRRISGPNEPRRSVDEILKSDVGFRKGVRIQYGLIFESAE